jgi:hypothetical protein
MLKIARYFLYMELSTKLILDITSMITPCIVTC